MIKTRAKGCAIYPYDLPKHEPIPPPVCPVNLRNWESWGREAVHKGALLRLSRWPRTMHLYKKGSDLYIYRSSTVGSQKLEEKTIGWLATVGPWVKYLPSKERSKNAN